jgi:Gp5 N-terminal OB domain
MNLFQGVVEDVNDPLKIGRVRVRVFGLHSDDRSLIPTNALPWATVLQPVTSASMSGIGNSPTGMLPGTWVALYFTDVDCQYPVVMGTLHGIPQDPAGQETATEEVEFSPLEAVTEEGVLKDASGNTVNDSNGEPVKVNKEPPAVAAKYSKVVPSELGSVSSKYESNGNPGTVNNYSSGVDFGGASYGAYQFASYLIAENTPSREQVTASQIKNSPVLRFIRTSEYAANFSGLSPATQAFDSVWRDLGRTQKTQFLAAQHKYVEKEYYQVAVSKLPSNITNRGKAVHEAIWSMSVQLGPSGAVSKIKSVLGNVTSDVCDDKLIEILYDSRILTVKQDFKSSPNLWRSLESRFRSERDQLIALARTYESGNCSPVEQTTQEKTTFEEDDKRTITTETVTRASPGTRPKGERGFTDPMKKYPLYYNEPDTNRLARGVITGTIVATKRASIITNKESGDVLISEPVTQYNTKYPFNKVFASESGHIIEIDDTPGYERVQVYHKSGTFIEMYPDGKMVTKAADSSTLVVNADRNEIVLGSSNAHVGTDENKTIEGNLKVTIYGNSNLVVNGDCNTTVTGDFNVTANHINLN